MSKSYGTEASFNNVKRGDLFSSIAVKVTTEEFIMGVYNRNGRWMVYFWENGKRTDRSFGKGDEGNAKALAFDEACKAHKAGSAEAPAPFSAVVDGPVAAPAPAFEPAPRPVPVDGLRLLDLTNGYLDHMRASGRSDTHVHNVELHVKNQFLPVLGNKVVNAMSYAGDILPFIRHFQEVSDRTGRKRSQTTVNRYTDYLNAVFNYGIEMELTKVNPMKGRRKTKERPREVQIGLDDVKKIMACADPHVRWAMEVAYTLGVRPGKSELFAIRYDQIDWEAAAIKIYAPKTKTSRVIPLSPAFMRRLLEMEKQSQSGFIVEYKGKQVGRINKGFDHACTRAGITVPTRMYDLRHLFATTMLSKGADLAAVSKLMGHSRVTMTADTYYQYLQGEKERAVALLPDIGAVG